MDNPLLFLKAAQHLVQLLHELLGRAGLCSQAFNPSAPFILTCLVVADVSGVQKTARLTIWCGLKALRCPFRTQACTAATKPSSS